MTGRGAVPGWVDLDKLAATDPDDDSWRPRAACGDAPSSVFFPPLVGGRFNYTAARQLCSYCPVKLQCLAAWLPTAAPGVDAQSGCYVGDTTPGERTAIRRALRVRSAA